MDIAETSWAVPVLLTCRYATRRECLECLPGHWWGAGPHLLLRGGFTASFHPQGGVCDVLLSLLQEPQSQVTGTADVGSKARKVQSNCSNPITDLVNIL